jgi:hypothetical protein
LQQPSCFLIVYSHPLGMNQNLAMSSDIFP